MKRPNTWWALIAVAILGMVTSGCGKGAAKDEPKAESEAEASNDAAPAAEAAPAPVAAPVAVAPAVPAPAAPAAPKSDTEELLALAGGSAPANGAAPAAAPIPGSRAGAAAAIQAPTLGAAGGGSGQNIGGNSPMPPGGYGGTAVAGGGSGQNIGGNSPMPPGGYGGSAVAGGEAALGAPPGGAGGGPGKSLSLPGRSGQGMTGQNPGAPQGPRPPGGPGGEMGPAGGGPGGGGALASSDFSTPIKGAESFLSALESHDPVRIKEASAKHAENDAGKDHIAFFKAVLSESASTEDVQGVANELAGMKVMGTNTRKSSGMLGVIVGKQEDNKRTTRTLQLRQEKEGWKVQDIGAAKVLKTQNAGGTGKRR